MRVGISNSSHVPREKNASVRNLARVLENALDSANLQKRFSLGSYEVQRRTPYHGAKQSSRRRYCRRAGVKYLEASGASGESQWGFKVGHSCRDLVALLMATWILDLHAGRKIGVYLSDISGAFDRVESSLLLKKLEAAGLNENLLAFLASYLAPRGSTVVVAGSQSEERVLKNPTR